MPASVSPRTRIVAAEDNYLIREGLRLLLQTQADLELVAIVDSLPALLATVDREGPDVVITDIRMPPGNSDEGIRAAETLARTHPGLGIVVLSQYVEAEWALRLFEPTAARRAYLLKERIGDISQLRTACETVRAGGSVLDPLVVEALIAARTRSSPLDALTPREREVLALVATGAANNEIARRLVLTERAVEKHITAVLAKLALDPEDGVWHRRVRAVLIYLAATDG